jgi:TetR/AcrR family tetracycline transcriptional repressor
VYGVYCQAIVRGLGAAPSGTVGKTSASSQSTRRVHGALAREQIVRLGLEIGDREGLGAVSFRRLAAELGVTPMALYRHVQGKADLLGAMAGAALAGLETWVPAGGTWQEALRGLLRGFGAVADAHPCAPALLLSAPPRSAEAFRATEVALEVLERAGFSPRDAAALVRQVTTLVVAPYVVYGGGAVVPAAGHGGGNGNEDGGEGGGAGEILPPEGLPRLRAALPHMADWSNPRRDRELAIELLVGGIEALRRRRGSRMHGSG